MTAERGTCPVCGRDMALSQYGRMRQHRGDRWLGTRQLPCVGVGELPTVPAESRR